MRRDKNQNNEFWLSLENFRDFGRDLNFSCLYPLLCVQYFFGSVVLSKHVSHYCPRSGFVHYDPTTTHREGTNYPPPRNALGGSITVQLFSCHQYPENCLEQTVFSALYKKIYLSFKRVRQSKWQIINHL
jgi:hypothetical protein